MRASRLGVPSAWYGHVPFAHWVVAACRPRILVELGTHHGVSYAAFCEAVARFGVDARCFAVDTWQGDGHAGQYDDSVYDGLRQFHDARFAGFSELLRCRFDQALPHFPDGSIDLLHIDGFHTYDAVRADFEGWLPKLSSRAVVLFHDTNVRIGDFGVWRLWDELSQRYPGFEFLHEHGLGVLAVGPDAPAAVQALCTASPAQAVIRERFALLGERWMDHFEATQAIAAQQRAEARIAGYADEVAQHEAIRTDAARLSEERQGLTARLAMLTADAKARQDTLDEAQADLETGWTYQAALKAQLAQQHAHTAELMAQLAGRAAEWERVHGVLGAKEHEIAHLQGRLGHEQAVRQAIYGSAWWRLGGPVRRLGRQVPWAGRGVRQAVRLLRTTLAGELPAYRRLRARRAAEVAALNATPLFDRAWYLAQHPDLAAAGHDAARHFAWVGAAAGAKPNPYFDTAWVMARAPSIASSGENPLLAWMRDPAQDPNPVFPVGWYRAQNPDIGQQDPISHWLATGRSAGRDPNPMLDARAYTMEHGDGPGFDPLRHWLEHGVAQRLDPHPLFDAAWYRAENALPPGTDVLAHWLAHPGLPVSALGGLLALAFPDQAAPDVSIIVPVYGHYGDTLRCLQAVLAHSGDGVRFEVIVADDKPTAPIAPLLRHRVAGLRIIENATNLGFLRSCNAAATTARGRHIVFLNNDTAVQPGWLAPLVRLADADPQIGLVGCKLLNPDGTVQEAGGAVLANGWGLPYGAGRDADAPELNFVRDVDVAIGACILVRREAWQQVGGFDDRYAPAFYEEFDLAFALRDRGWRVVYQPASAVVHHGSNSYGSAARDRHSANNHRSFLAKWAKVLVGQPATGDLPLVVRSRPAPRGTALVIDDRVPEWDRNAGAVTLRQYLHLLQSMGWNVVFCPAFDPAPTQPYTATLQQEGIEVLHAPETLAGWLRLNGQQVGLVWTARPDVTAPILDLLRAETRAPILYYTHDLHHLRERRRFELDGDPRALAASKRYKRIEDRIFAAVDHVMTPSGDEAAVIRTDVPGADVHVIPPYLVPAVPLGQPGPAFADRDALIFVGGYNHLPNVDAAVWLVDAIMPLVWAALPGVELLLVGNAPPPEVVRLAGPRVTVTGFVPDVAPFYGRSRLSVSPLRYGAGVKGKIVAALQEGVPVVTTGVGNEGLGLCHGLEAWIADDAAGIAAGIVALYGDPARCGAMAAAGADVLRRDFSEDAARAALMRVLGESQCQVCGAAKPLRAEGSDLNSAGADDAPHPGPLPGGGAEGCRTCGADALAQGMAGVVLRGLPGRRAHCVEAALPRLARMAVRVGDDAPAALARSLRPVAGATRAMLQVGGAPDTLLPRGRLILAGTPADAAPFIAAGLVVVAHGGAVPILEITAPA